MKKVISLFLISLLAFSMFGCKQETYTDDTAVNIIENETPLGSTEQVTDKQNTEGTEDVTDEVPETAPEEQPLEDTHDATPDTETEVTETETDNESETQEETAIDTYLSPDVQLPEGFSDPLENIYKLEIHDKLIHVILTLEESAKQKESYTPEDFPYIDVESIQKLMTHYPEKENKVIINITLQHSEKEAMINAINALLMDERVYYAAPAYVMEVILPY